MLNKLLQYSIILCSITLMAASLHGQDLITEHNGSYTYQGEEYELLDLTHIMHERTNAYNIYIEGKNQYHIGRSVGLAGIGIIALGTTSLLAISKPQTDYVLDIVFTELANEQLRIIGKTFLAGGLTLGLIGLSNRFKGTKNMKRAIQIYNTEGDDIGYNYQPKLNIGLTNNGMGLILFF